MMLIQSLYAQTAVNAANPQPSMFEYLVLPMGVAIIMYLFMIRPQQKRQREQVELLKNLKVGQEVVTSGGIIAKIKSVADSFVTLELSGGGSVKVQKANVVSATQAQQGHSAVKKTSK